MMESRDGAVVLDQIPVKLDVTEVIKQMHLHGDKQRYENYLRELIQIVTPLARPKALYKVCCVDKKESDSLEIDGVKFNGRLIVDTLEGVDTVFVCVATCGREVESVEIPAAEVMKRYCLDMIKTALIFTATTYLDEYLKKHYSLDNEISRISPGEIKAFPSTQHKNIFAVLGDVEGKIGLKLTEYCALVPTKSSSGIFFSKETKFISCRMCTQKRCMGRRAAYDAELARPYQ
jgi:hypothetical protein